jgi:hypothetical protein
MKMGMKAVSQLSLCKHYQNSTHLPYYTERHNTGAGAKASLDDKED